MGMSVAAATDYLVTLAESAAAAVTVNGEPVTVWDGFPLAVSNAMLVVGLDQPPDDATASLQGTRSWVGFGQHITDEDYTVPCFIDVRAGDVDQKTLRDTACTVFDAFYAALRADPTLGGALTLYAEVVDFVLIPTSVTAGALQGRRVLISFSVHCRSRYTT